MHIGVYMLAAIVLPFLYGVMRVELAVAHSLIFEASDSVSTVSHNTENFYMLAFLIAASIAIIFLFIIFYQAKRHRKDEKEAFYQAILEATVDGVIVIDEKGSIEAFNPACEVLFGYKAEEVMGKNIKCLMPKKYENEHDTYLSNYLKTGKKKIIGIDRELEAKHKDGSIFPVELSVSEVNLGNNRKFTGVLRDITQRKQVETDLRLVKEELELKVIERTADLSRALEDAKYANRAKSDFLANMSHELRTPMHAIMSFSNLGMKKKDAPEEQQEFFQLIYSSGERLLGLLNNLLDLSKLEAGKLMFQFETKDMVKAVKTVANELKSVIKENKLTLNIEQPNCSTVFPFDYDKIIQVVHNLLSNAIKFSSEGKEITISFRDVDITNTDGNKDIALEISITDEGIGIPEEELDTIFDKFVQSSKTQSNAGGTGLGLAICQEIIRAHHGRIWAEHALGGGAKFIFFIPKTLQNIN